MHIQLIQDPSDLASGSDIIGFEHMFGTMLSALSVISWALLPAGVILVIIAMGLLLRTATRGSLYAPLSSAVVPLVSGLMLIVLSFMVGSWKQKNSPSEHNPSPSPAPSPDISPTPSPTPRQPAEPIVLPEVHNLGFLWIVPLAIISFAALYFLVRKVRADAAAKKAVMEDETRVATLIASKWEAVRAQHRELVRNFMKAETDWDMLFSYPTLQDSSVRQTAAMIRAMMKAANSNQDQPSTLNETSDLSRYPYPQAVSAFEHAWYIAYEHAKKVGQSRIPSEERRLIKKIQQMLELAENSGATSSERDLAYSRISKMIKSLKAVRIPPKALREIESARQLMIES